MKIILKGLNNKNDNFPKITGEGEGLLITPKEGCPYEIDCDNTDYVFINMDEVVSVQLKLKDEEDSVDELWASSGVSEDLKSEGHMTIKDKVLYSRIWEEAYEIKTKLYENLTEELTTKIELGFPRSMLQDILDLREKIDNMSVSEFLDMKIDEELKGYIE